MFGLDLPRLSNIRSTITGEDPLPLLNQVHSRVIREEKNKNISQNRDVAKIEKIGFSVKTDMPSQVSSVSGQCFRDRSTLSCTHRRRQGHEVRECFQLHGYPKWFYEQNRTPRTTICDVKPVVRGSRGVRGT